ncbi:APC family permease [Qipengyuania sp. SM2507]
MALERSMGLGTLTFYGTGTILGAGIFVVVGEVVGEAGVLAPIAYLLAGLVAFTTALSFAEMGARVPDAGGPMEYAAKGFGREWLSGATGWMLILANLVSAATIVTGFISYLDSFVEVPGWMAKVGLVIAITGVSVAGMKQSAWFMSGTTLIGIATLLFVLWVTKDSLFAAPGKIVSADGLGAGAATGIFAGAFLAIYSFIGFGDMGQTAEEVKDVKKTLPRAMIASLIIVFVFYIAISLALVGSDDIDGIASAQAPLVEAVAQEGWPKMPIAIASLFIIVNGALAQIVAASRMIMDMARDNRSVMPKQMEQVSDRTNTPIRATVVSGAVVLALTLFFPLKTLASGTSLAILLVFGVVNAALWRLKPQSQPEDVPDMWAVVPILGTVFCVLAVVGQIALWVLGFGGEGGH